MFDYDDIFPIKPKMEKRSEKSSNWMNAIMFFLLLFGLFRVFDLSWFFMAGLIFVLLLHELGHFIAMKALGYEDVQIKIVPLFGIAIQGSKKIYSQREKVIVALSGPLPSLIIGVLLILFYDVPVEYVSDVSLLFIAIVVVNVLNLLPLEMFDGGKMFESVFFFKNDQGKFIFALVSSLLMILIGVLLQNLFVAAFGFILGLKVRSLHKLRDIRTVLKEKEVNYETTFGKLTDRSYWLIRDVVIENSKTLKEVVPDLREIWENEPVLMNQIDQILESPIKKDLSIMGKVLSLALWILAVSYPIYLILSTNLISLVDGI